MNRYSKMLATVLAVVSLGRAYGASSLVPSKQAELQGRIDRAFVGSKISIDCYLDPCSLIGDFDGDGKPDTAVLVKSSKGIRGIVFMRGDGPLRTVGLERPVRRPNYKDAVPNYLFDILAWSLHHQADAADPGSSERISGIKADFIELEGEESSAPGYLYWNGHEFVVYQVND